VAKRLQSDRILYITTLALVVFGLLMVFSASAVISSEQYGHPYYFLGRQLAWAAAGVLAMIGGMRIDYRLYRDERFIVPALSITLLLLAAVLFMDASHATHRWFRWGPLSFQPSELAKPVLIIFLAWFLENRLKTDSLNDKVHTLLPICLVVGATVALILGGRDLGTSLMILLIALSMLFVAGLNMIYLAWAPVAAIPAFYVFVYRVPFRMDRIRVWFDPFRDPGGKGFNMVQSFIAVGTGGLFGAGLMSGKQKLFFLPAAHTDFIFAVICEELGLFGAALLVMAFGVFFWRGMVTARLAPDLFGRLLAIGITVMIVFQAFINFSVVLGLLPAKGIPLPFISYGGSSLLFNMAAVGILLNVTRHSS
jgi:cell division protein FtsW